MKHGCMAMLFSLIGNFRNRNVNQSAGRGACVLCISERMYVNEYNKYNRNPKSDESL